MIKIPSTEVEIIFDTDDKHHTWLVAFQGSHAVKIKSTFSEWQAANKLRRHACQNLIGKRLDTPSI